MAHFRQKLFQLKSSSSSTEKLSDFNCIAPENPLKNGVNDAESRAQNHNKPFRLLPRVNSSGTYTILVNRCKVKYFKKEDGQKC